MISKQKLKNYLSLSAIALSPIIVFIITSLTFGYHFIFTSENLPRRLLEYVIYVSFFTPGLVTLPFIKAEKFNKWLAAIIIIIISLPLILAIYLLAQCKIDHRCF